jgi:uncharacterized protein YihD (DUF1040 family)
MIAMNSGFVLQERLQKLRELLKEPVHVEQHIRLVQQVQQVSSEIFNGFLAELKGVIARYAPALEFMRAQMAYVGYQVWMEEIAVEVVLELIKRGYWFDPENFVVTLRNAIRRELQSADDEYLESLLHKLEWR